MSLEVSQQTKGRVLVTGANGFIGRHLCQYLHSSGFRVTGAVRDGQPDSSEYPYHLVSVGDIGGDVDWQQHLDGIEAVVHLASRVHVMREVESDPLKAFRRVNVAGTSQLVSGLSAGTINRFVFLSTIKVYGERTSDRPISVDDELRPQDPYTVSKCEAEVIVEGELRDKGIPFTIIRPPLVYGPGVGGNFLRLLNLVESGMPLPLGRVGNQRSMVGVGNLCDLVRECLVNDDAGNKKLLVSDNDDISTPDLIRKMAKAMSRPDRVFSVPIGVLRTAGLLLRRQPEIDRLVESLVIDIGETVRTLGWTPPNTLDQGVSETVAWYTNRKRDG